ncbi:hypothetical protein Csp2054_07490 [Curtobacterium sp. 'Ferrero']|uniref:hypothetical protein n=1 Tax=Curtobacterium sp. 'Ferrero' TaxID=2033654 RepID=UPI000BC72D15|nr:hypothetical protein [Curtobacterium sp. 'Ferrero']PCN48256.1 hypothetical protein Csp2054_07490 [Curtobacterium sp. 'Ferrero']
MSTTTTPDHPAIVRLRLELDAAWKSICALGGLADDRRGRVVAELRTAVPDVASRAALLAGADAAVAEINRFAAAEVVLADVAEAGSVVPSTAIWDDIVHTAAEAAVARR